MQGAWMLVVSIGEGLKAFQAKKKVLHGQLIYIMHCFLTEKKKNPLSVSQKKKILASEKSSKSPPESQMAPPTRRTKSKLRFCLLARIATTIMNQQ